jgi:peptidylprolyl isomerase
MKRTALLFALAAPVLLHGAAAQTPTTPAPKPATAAAKPAVGTAARKPGTAAASTGIKLPPGVPPVRGLLKTAFALRYQEIKVGTGADAEPGKLYKVHYTGWLATDGKKFDSSFDHRRPVLDKDGKPENDADGKPKMGDPEPIQFPQGRRGVIPGWDQGFAGMKVGGKRRLFIPYQLAYGEQGRPPVIPPKSDLIFDIELVDVSDLPTQPRPGMPGGRQMPSRPGAAPGAAPGATPAPPTGTPPTSPTAPAPTAKPTDPTAPTVAPNSAPPTAAPTPGTPPPTPPTAPPDKPANPAQPQA